MIIPAKSILEPKRSDAIRQNPKTRDWRIHMHSCLTATLLLWSNRLWYSATPDTLLVSKMIEFDKELDASGLNCPLPILRTKKALTDMTSGQVLRIIATDPGAVKDFQAFAKQTGNPLLEHSEEKAVHTFFMQKK